MYFHFVRSMVMIVSCLTMFFSSAYPKLPDEEMQALIAARETLEQLGIEVSYEAFCAAKQMAKSRLDFMKLLQEEEGEEAKLRLSYAQMYQTPEQRVYDLLVSVGYGDMNGYTWFRKPYSRQVYAFDAEVFDIERCTPISCGAWITSSLTRPLQMWLRICPA